MKKTLILLSFLSFACAENIGIDPSCGAKQFYDEINNQCLAFCETDKEGYEFNEYTNKYVCTACTKDNQYINKNGLCITCNINNQVIVNDGNNNFYCKNITPCSKNTDCDKNKKLVCNNYLAYCVNCISDENCGPGTYCQLSQYDGTCLPKKTLGKRCNDHNECSSKICNNQNTCGCTNNNECILYGISINETFNTCKNYICSYVTN